MGIEPTSEAWEASILPLYDARSIALDSTQSYSADATTSFIKGKDCLVTGLTKSLTNVDTGEFYWLQHLPVTQELAGSSPVAPTSKFRTYSPRQKMSFGAACDKACRQGHQHLGGLPDSREGSKERSVVPAVSTTKSTVRLH